MRQRRLVYFYHFDDQTDIREKINFKAGEYFALAAIMVGATGIFVLLSIFYYEYVPEGTFADKDEDEIKNGPEIITSKDLKPENVQPEISENGVENEALTEEAEF